MKKTAVSKVEFAMQWTNTGIMLRLVVFLCSLVNAYRSFIFLSFNSQPSAHLRAHGKLSLLVQ